MKPTKMRNNMIYRATFQTRSKQLGSALSKDLRKKYGKRSVRAIEGDSVTILRGEFKGVEGKISKVSTQKSSVAIEGVKKEKTKGDKFDVYIHTSNLLVTSLSTDDKWRISKLEGKNPSKQPKETPVKEEPKETKVTEKIEKKEDEN
ncbi:50S ribosomal protein L24 [Nitrosopumilus ureiphilus]|uniref:Large ribosomal subunit protein uL24 n=1 Tax=Nitrosopumilus ureiphilus TaxID=1470067 RepID=A0A7D5M4S0_9ARCH|nr:50S ribosomal protein L24 [Nitrosopumilus ureiphilus]QLH06692.1 50S ribosomal protein L24 [Nitrosopumilus ureiphilus]